LLLHALEMKEDERVSLVDDDTRIEKRDAVVADIPGRKIGADVLDHLDPRETGPKSLQIALIGKALAIDIVVAPIDTLLAPPFNPRQAVRLVSRADPADIVDAVFAHMSDRRRVAMRDDGESRILDLVEDRIWWSEEEKIAVEIGHPFRGALVLQDM